MKKINQIQQKNELVVELLKRNNKLLSDLIKETKNVLDAISDIKIVQNKQLVKIEQFSLTGIPNVLKDILENLQSIIRLFNRIPSWPFSFSSKTS